MTDLLEVGAKVKALRRERGLTRDQLAARARVSRARIEALENERAPEMGFNAVHRLLRVLGQDLVITTFNRKRPTYEDLVRENEQMKEGGR